MRTATWERRLAWCRRIAGAHADLLEPLFAAALCAALEGCWRAGPAASSSAAGLAQGLCIAAPLTLAAVAAYMRANAARLRARRRAVALYRVLGGNMALATGRQALFALLRLLSGAGAGMAAAAQLARMGDLAFVPFFPLTALGALAAATAVAGQAAWSTWRVPASYDLAAGGDGAAADDDGIEAQLRALYAASALLAPARPGAATRYRQAVNPLFLLALYIVLIEKQALGRHASDADADADAGGHAPQAGHGAVHSTHERGAFYLAAAAPEHGAAAAPADARPGGEPAAAPFRHGAAQGIETPGAGAWTQPHGRDVLRFDLGDAAPFAAASAGKAASAPPLPEDAHGVAPLPEPEPHAAGVPAAHAFVFGAGVPVIAFAVELGTNVVAAIDNADGAAPGLAIQGPVPALVADASIATLAASVMHVLSGTAPVSGDIGSLYGVIGVAAPHPGQEPMATPAVYAASTGDLLTTGIVIVGQAGTGHATVAHPA